MLAGQVVIIIKQCLQALDCSHNNYPRQGYYSNCVLYIVAMHYNYSNRIVALSDLN